MTEVQELKKQRTSYYSKGIVWFRLILNKRRLPKQKQYFLAMIHFRFCELLIASFEIIVYIIYNG